MLQTLLKIPRTSKRRLGTLVILVVALIFLPGSIFAQLKLVQLPRGASSEKTTGSARTQAAGLPLPFYDDFSDTPLLINGNSTGGVPNQDLWETSSLSVYVNPGNGILPPSINVATLDGLNRDGNKYADAVLSNGYADTLVSKPIDLSETSVPLPDRDSVYLSFFYQWGGNAEVPDKKDFFVLEFKNIEGNWIPVDTIRPEGAMNKAIFKDYFLRITDNQYFFDQFQFRFRNFGRLTGPFDAWHIDNIYLNKKRTAFWVPDVAFTKQLSPLFGNYHAMPLAHFRDSVILNKVSGDVFGLYGITPEDIIPIVGYNSEWTFDNYLPDNVLITTKEELNALHEIQGDGSVPYLEHRAFVYDTIPDSLNTTYFNPLALRTDITYKFNIQFQDDPDDDDESQSAPDPAPFNKNDTLRTTYTLADYYAYDDGSAEYAAILTNPGVRVAYAFDVLRTSETPAFLSGFDVYFPKYAIVPNLSTSFFILDDNNGEPGEVLLTFPTVTMTEGPINEFQFIEIFEQIPVGKRFYIGWEAPVGGQVAVGVDFNTDNSDKILYRANGVWNVNEDVLGSLMIRPHFGDGVYTGVE